MKKFLLPVAVVAIFTACNTNPNNSLDVKRDMAPVNTAGYTISNASTDVAAASEETYVAPASKKTVVVRTVTRKPTQVQREIVYVPAPAPKQTAPVISNEGNSAPSTTPSVNGLPSPAGSGETASTGNASTAPETVPKKKGWSDAAKGAVIGGAAGAIGGAIINGKNRGAGAVVGAVIGAAGGYAIGRKRDNNKKENDFSMVVN